MNKVENMMLTQSNIDDSNTTVNDPILDNNNTQANHEALHEK